MLRLEHVRFAYPNSEPIIKDLSLAVAPRERVGLVGCNGAGKSTLLSILCGINLPTAGTVVIDGTELGKGTLPRIRKTVGMVFQNPDDQLFMPNVLEDVAFGPKNYGLSEAEAKEKAMTALKRMGIEALADRPPYRLSGGETRSAAIASILSMDPSFILFDEPSAFLDPGAKKNFEATVHGLDVGFLIASHDLDVILRTCERVLILKKGDLIADGDPNVLLKDESILAEAGLELPESYRYCRECPHHPANA